MKREADLMKNQIDEELKDAATHNRKGAVSQA